MTPALYYKAHGEEYVEERKIATNCVIRKNGEFVAKFDMLDEVLTQQVRFDPCILCDTGIEIRELEIGGFIR